MVKFRIFRVEYGSVPVEAGQAATRACQTPASFATKAVVGQSVEADREHHSGSERTDGQDEPPVKPLADVEQELAEVHLKSSRYGCMASIVQRQPAAGSSEEHV
jgi:hypothetical protein